MLSTPPRVDRGSPSVGVRHSIMVLWGSECQPGHRIREAQSQRTVVGFKICGHGDQLPRSWRHKKAAFRDWRCRCTRSLVSAVRTLAKSVIRLPVAEMTPERPIHFIRELGAQTDPVLSQSVTLPLSSPIASAAANNFW